MPHKGSFLPSYLINPYARMNSAALCSHIFVVAGDAILCVDQHLRHSTRFTDFWRREVSDWMPRLRCGPQELLLQITPVHSSCLANTQVLHRRVLCSSPLTHTVVNAQALNIHPVMSLCIFYSSLPDTLLLTFPILTKFLLIFKNKFIWRKVLNNSLSVTVQGI